jgi:hypothetical protein
MIQGRHPGAIQVGRNCGKCYHCNHFRDNKMNSRDTENDQIFFHARPAGVRITEAEYI